MEQATLPWDDPEPSELDKKFWEFHKKNPQVFDELVALARKAKAAGRKRIGMQMLFEVIRWQRYINTKGDPYKINNNYASRYARIIPEKFPEFEGMFETRRIRS